MCGVVAIINKNNLSIMTPWNFRLLYYNPSDRGPESSKTSLVFSVVSIE